MLTLNQPPTAPHLLPSKPQNIDYVVRARDMMLEGLLEEVRDAFESRLSTTDLLNISTKIQAEFKEHLITSPQCMLPSHNYILPTGQEHGTYLAVEVGGSTLRIALVDLEGRGDAESLGIRRIESYPIPRDIRHLEDLGFFDWIALQIRQMLDEDRIAQNHRPNPEPLPMGIAWSFPVDQTSIRTGKILGLGKGFYCSKAVTGLDLNELMTSAFQRAGLNIRLDAIINDSSAALLSRAYVDPSTRMALILGTGINAAIHLPIASLHPDKFGERDMPTGEGISHILVNTELSMFGKRAYPTNRWDETVNNNHIIPNYQPMEYLIAGGYISELVRLIVTEATEAHDLFNGTMPSTLTIPYALDARILATLESDTSASLAVSRSLWQEQHPNVTAPTYQDMLFVQQVTRSICRRSCAYAAAAVHALASLLEDLEVSYNVTSKNIDHIKIGCDGSIINKYPGYMDATQQILDTMTSTDSTHSRSILLERTIEPAVAGAAVAVAMASPSS